MKKCSKCGVELILGENWTLGNAKIHNNICKKCAIYLSSKYYQKNKVEINQRAIDKSRQQGMKPKRDTTIRKNSKKYCPNCKKWEDESEFYIDKTKKDSLSSWCKSCHNEPSERKRLRAKENWQKNKKEMSKRNKDYYQSLKGKYHNYKKGAEHRNYKFELSLFDFATIIIQPCYYCGKKDSIYTGVDRIDSSKGYSVDNCAPCCTSCNIAKMAHTEKEFKEDTDRRFLHTLLKPFKELKEPITLY